MGTKTQHEIEKPTPPRDLRAKLFHDLSTGFAKALESNGSLPAAAQEALVQLLDSESPTAAEVIVAALKDDSLEEVGDG